MERNDFLIYLFLAAVVTIPITVGLFMVKNDISALNVDSIAGGINDINTNLKSIDTVLENLGGIDPVLIRKILIMLNETLSKNLLTNSIDIPVDGNLPSQDTPTLPNLDDVTNNLRRL